VSARIVDNKKKVRGRMHVYIFSDSATAACTPWEVKNSIIDAGVFGLYAHRSQALYTGVGAATCISDVYRCFHS
jgi:hypothetical protein